MLLHHDEYDCIPTDIKKKVYFLGFCQKASGAIICIEDGVLYTVKLHKNNETLLVNYCLFLLHGVKVCAPCKS